MKKEIQGYQDKKKKKKCFCCGQTLEMKTETSVAVLMYAIFAPKFAAFSVQTEFMYSV